MTQGLDIGTAPPGTKDLTLAEVSNDKGSSATADQRVAVGKVSTHHSCYRLIDFKVKINAHFLFEKNLHFLHLSPKEPAERCTCNQQIGAAVLDSQDSCTSDTVKRINKP